MTDCGRTSAPLVLDGILVAEVGQRLAVGACGSLLAQLGADVIAIELPHPAGADKDAHRPAVVAGKRSVVIDNGVAHDCELLRELAARADVILLSSDDGSGHAALWERAESAGQLVVDVTAFGHGGPNEGRGLSESLLQAEMGLVDTTGRADGEPVPIGVPVLELAGAVHAAAAVLLALRVRRQHGFGQRIDIALADVAVNTLVNFIALHHGGRAATRSGNRHPLYAPWGCYHAADGYLLACSVSDEQFARLCGAIGNPGLVDDPRFATPAERVRHFRDIDTVINNWAGTRTVAECERALTEVGVPSGGIVEPSGLVNEPNLVHRATLAAAIDPESADSVYVPRSPVRGDRLPPPEVLHIPSRGEDRAAVVALLPRRPPPAGGRPDAAAPAPLAGVRVVEIGHYTVAPLASRILGSFGADVIKVEPPAGDAIRGGAPLRDDGSSYIFALSNTDKRGLVLDLRREADRERLHALLARADILVENLRPGALARLGFGSDELRARHPRLVYCAITGFGHDSVYAGRAALDSVIQAMSGMMAFTHSGGEPAKTGISASDNFGGLVGMLACLAGLELRDLTGAVSHFDVSMQDASAWMTLLGCGGARASVPRIAPAADGYVLYVVPGESGTPVAQLGHLTREAAVAALAARGIEAAPVRTVSEVLSDPYVRARELLVLRPSRDGSAWQVLASPMRLARTPPRVRSTMGALGADDQEVLAELAG